MQGTQLPDILEVFTAHITKVFGLILEFMTVVVSETALFDTYLFYLYFPEQEGYRLVSKLVSKSKFQNLAYVISFDTIVV